jgi:hypothetical protein
MHSFAAVGAGFLLAVLWFDLMFDVQTRKYPGDLLPPEVLASISAYYRRVTTEAYPMNRLVALVMVLTLAAICAEIVQGVDPWWIGWVSIALAGSGFVLTITRTVPNAVRLASARDTAEQQSTLARDLSGSSIQLCAHDGRTWLAADGAIRAAAARAHLLRTKDECSSHRDTAADGGRCS